MIDFDLRPLFYLALVGALTLVGGAAWLVYFILTHNFHFSIT